MSLSDLLNGMESENTAPAPDTESAREALASLSDDRLHVAARLRSQTWWSAPAQGLAAAAFIAAPAAGIAVPMSFVLALSSLAFFGIDRLARTRTGLAPRSTPGRGSLAILIVACVGLVVCLGLSLTLAIIERPEWILATAIGGFVVMTTASALYDRVSAREILCVR